MIGDTSYMVDYKSRHYPTRVKLIIREMVGDTSLMIGDTSRTIFLCRARLDVSNWVESVWVILAQTWTTRLGLFQARLGRVSLAHYLCTYSLEIPRRII